MGVRRFLFVGLSAGPNLDNRLVCCGGVALVGGRRDVRRAKQCKFCAADCVVRGFAGADTGRV